MKKLGAYSILLTMCLGLSAFAGRTMIKNMIDIAALKTKEEIIYDDLKEIKRDIKILLQREK